MSRLALSPSPFTTVLAGLPGRLAAGFARVWRALRREYRLHATIRTLSDLDDRTLSDIGLHRGQIAEIVRRRSRGE